MSQPRTRSGSAAHEPQTREELMAAHAEWRHRRDAAPLGSPEFRRAIEELARIEIEIARLDRSTDPPRV